MEVSWIFNTSPTNPTGVVFGYETGVNIHDIYRHPQPRRCYRSTWKGTAFGPPFLKQGTLVVDRHLDHWKARDLRKSMLAMTPINLFDVLLVDDSLKKTNCGASFHCYYIWFQQPGRLSHTTKCIIVMRRRYVRDVCWRVQCRCPSESNLTERVYKDGMGIMA